MASELRHRHVPHAERGGEAAARAERCAMLRGNSKTGNAFFLGILFVLSVLVLVAMFLSFPRLSDDDAAHILKWPSSVEDLRDMSAFLTNYRNNHYGAVLTGFCVIYIFLQAFAIPGAIFLSILAGPLFGVYSGLFIVSCVATLGAAICYNMSYYLGRGLVKRFFPSQLDSFRTKIEQHRHNLFFYLLFLRISPLLPNWFISVSSPILDVPLSYFLGATFIGLVPANYIHVTTGMTLSTIESVHGFDPKKILILFAIAFVALIPTLFRKKFEEVERRMGADARAAGEAETEEMLDNGHA